VLDQILVMLHPFMPFVTEELWNALGERPYELIVAKWPMSDARALDPEAAREISWVIDFVSQVRKGRTELSVPPGAILPFNVDVNSLTEDTRAFGKRNQPAIERLARIKFSDEPSILYNNELIDIFDFKLADMIGKSKREILAGSMTVTVEGLTGYVPLEGVIDIAAEQARLQKAAEAAEKERDSLAARLGNPSFVERAKPEAVEKARADHAEKASDAEKYRAALARLA
jgi:valyl-tRNA synthetase